MKLGIICAMPEESKLLKQNLRLVDSQTVGNVVIDQGTIGKHEIYLCQSGIGKVQAAITATLLAQIEGLDALINTGSAGGIGKGLTIGETIVSTGVAYTDVDVTGFGYHLGQLPNQPLIFQADQALVTDITMAAQAKQMPVQSGLIVSGDQFVNDNARIQEILQLYPDALANEMEGAAVGQVATQFGVPFVVIRALSDVANGNAAIDFDEFIQDAGKKSAALLLNFLENT